MHTKQTEIAKCCIPRVNTPFMIWTFDRFREPCHKLWSIWHGQHDDRTFDGDRLAAETLAKFFWRLNDFSALTSALAPCVLFRDEYRSSITNKTTYRMVDFIVKLFERRRDWRTVLSFVFLYSQLSEREDIVALK